MHVMMQCSGCEVSEWDGEMLSLTIEDDEDEPWELIFHSRACLLGWLTTDEDEEDEADVMATDHNAIRGVMASDDVMPTSCDWCGSADHLIHHCPDMERDGREAGAREAAVDKSDWPL